MLMDAWRSSPLSIRLLVLVLTSTGRSGTSGRLHQTARGAPGPHWANPSMQTSVLLPRGRMLMDGSKSSPLTPMERSGISGRLHLVETGTIPGSHRASHRHHQD